MLGPLKTAATQGGIKLYGETESPSLTVFAERHSGQTSTFPEDWENKT